MRAERNTHSRNLIELQDEIRELRRKLQMLVRACLWHQVQGGPCVPAFRCCSLAWAMLCPLGAGPCMRVCWRAPAFVRQPSAPRCRCRHFAAVQNHQTDQLKQEISAKDSSLVKVKYDHIKVLQLSGWYRRRAWCGTGPPCMRLP